VEVAQLYQAGNRVAAHMGEEAEQERNAWGALRALQAGLPHQDPRVLAAHVEVAEMFARTRRYHAAISQFDFIAREAAAQNDLALAAQASLRAAWLTYSRTRSAEAKRRIEALARRTEPQVGETAIAARILLARTAYAEGRPEAAAEFIRQLAQQGPERLLIHSPPFQPQRLQRTGDRDSSEPDSYSPDRGGIVTSERTGTRFDHTKNPAHFSEPDTHRETWVDVGFRIRGDGRVEDAEIIRSSGTSTWAQPVLSAIGGRIYSPSANGSSDYRVERYSLTSHTMSATGTRMRRHSGEARIEQIELTER
jgi:hypothetical protein